MRLVLDTNTVISALLWTGVPHGLLAAARARRATTLHTSAKLLAELVDVLSRDKLASAVAANETLPRDRTPGRCSTAARGRVVIQIEAATAKESAKDS